MVFQSGGEWELAGIPIGVGLKIFLVSQQTILNVNMSVLSRLYLYSLGHFMFARHKATETLRHFFSEEV